MADKDSEAYKRGEQVGAQLAETFFTGIQKTLSEAFGDPEPPEPPASGYQFTREQFQELRRGLEELYESTASHIAGSTPLNPQFVLSRAEIALDVLNDVGLAE